MTAIPEAALRARQLYLDGVAVDAIKRETGLNLHKIYLWLAGGPETDGVRPLPPIPLRRVNVFSGKHQNARASLVARMMSAAERQVREIEEKLMVSDAELEGRERNARVLAVLVKTLNDLSAADAHTPRKKKAKAHDDDPVPREAGELRRELARRLDRLVDEAKAACPDEIARD